MAKKKLKFGSIEIHKKFKDGEEAFRYAKRLREKIKDFCKRNANKGWYAQAMIVCSNLESDVALAKYENNGKVGRPRKLLVVNEYSANNWYKGNYHTDWHIHCILLSKPSYAFKNAIKDYIDKRWKDIEDTEKIEFDINKINKGVAYKKNCNIKLADYFINQGDKVLFCNYNYSNEEDLKYTLKQYHNEYLKLDNAKIKLYKENVKQFMGEERFLKRLNQIENRFNEISNYFYDISKEDILKEKELYMKKARLDKILSSYDNKVQEISHQRIWDTSVL